MEPNYIHQLEFAVRDYECDIQGIVNNANYQHYFEHARHNFLLSKNIDFAQLHEEGIDLIVFHVDIYYKQPLHSGDKFVVKSYFQKEGNIRVSFYQDIYRVGDDTLMTKGIITCVAIQNGRPIRPDFLLEKLGLL